MSLEYPNLFIPGAAKSGTSTLHELLNLHSCISMSLVKEPFYWVKNEFDSYSEFDKSNYFSLFKSKPNIQYKGESSTSYMLFPNFIERIKQHNAKDLKFIFILRNPIDRLYSHYWYIKGLGDENLALKEAVMDDKNDEPKITSHHKNGRYKHYFQYGLYGKWLSKFYEAFEANQIKIIIFEEFKENPLQTLNSCFDFLGLDAIESIPALHSNETILLKYPKFYSGFQDLTKGRIKLIKPLNKFVPKPIKSFLKKDVSKMIVENTKTSKSYPILSESDRKWVSSLYENDFKLLKKVTGKDFYLWKDFN